MLNLNRIERLLSRLHIRDRDNGRKVPFIFNPNQRMVMEKMKKWQARGRGLRYIVLKSRRVGISAQASGILACHCMAQEMAEAMIVAHQAKSSQALFQIPKMLMRDLPALAIDTTNQNKIIFPHDDGDSTLTIATAGSVVGGRGLTLSALHCSEAAYWKGVESFASLLPAVTRGEDGILIIESTANGTVGIGETFYEYWNAAIEGRNDFCPIFLTHLDDPACRVKLFKGEEPKDIGSGDIADYEKEMVQLMLKRKMGWQEQMERIAWVRSTFETQCQGNSQMLSQEYPITPDMAFISSGYPAFETSEMSWANESVTEPFLRGIFKDNGKHLPGTIEERGDGEWSIWEPTIEGHHYYMGADAAAGLEIVEGGGRPSDAGDFAAICIWDGETGHQVAEMSARFSPEKLADELNKAGRYYNNALATIELTGNLGRWAQTRLRDYYHYPNFYRWKGRDDAIGSRNQMAKRQGIGWDTTATTREMMFSAFRAALRAQVVTPRSRALVSQMRVCSRIEGFRWDVVRGHDDLLMAAMVGWIAREQWPPPTHLGGKRPALDDSDFTTPLRIEDDASTMLIRHHQKIMAYTKGHAIDRLNGV